MKVKKNYSISMSKIFGDGTIMVTKYGTELEEEGADPDSLFEQAAAATRRDLIKQVRADPMAKSVFESVKSAIKKEKKVSEAQKEFDDE